MGKPYGSEMARLAATYAWAKCVPLDNLAVAIGTAGALPLIVLGSGGSLTAAQIAVMLHQRHSGNVAKAMTPLELMRTTLNWRRAAVLVLSAEGKNADVIGAVTHIVHREPSCLCVLCMRPNSRLANLTRTYQYGDTVDFDLPWGKDGFLATNSLLACALILYRAYAQAFSAVDCVPDDLGALLGGTDALPEGMGNGGLRDRCLPLWTRDTVLVLHGMLTSAATAIDLESKFMEAALGNLHIADYRNFAHGRHYWLAKHGNTTAVLALVAEEDRDIADRTLRLIPPAVPVVRIDVPQREQEPVSPRSRSPCTLLGTRAWHAT